MINFVFRKNTFIFVVTNWIHTKGTEMGTNSAVLYENFDMRFNEKHTLIIKSKKIPPAYFASSMTSLGWYIPTRITKNPITP